MRLLHMPDAAPGLAQLANRIISELSNAQKVLWLIPGGSNIPISVQIMNAIPAELTTNLTLALTDERYGPVDHPDSNWRQLALAGFNAQQARTIAVLQPNANLEETAVAYDAVMQQLLVDIDVVIGQFGMGPDGHIAGILPHTVATSANGFVIGYATDKFGRITLTFNAIRHCTMLCIFAFGEEKRPMLENLQRDLPLDDQPAQIIKEVKESFVCNDQLGETV